MKLSFPYSRDQLMFLMQHDSDGFNRWEAGQQLSVQVLQELIASASAWPETLVLDQRLVERLSYAAGRPMIRWIRPWSPRCSRCQVRPTSQKSAEVADVEAIHAAREFARKQLADAPVRAAVGALPA